MERIGEKPFVGNVVNESELHDAFVFIGNYKTLYYKKY